LKIAEERKLNGLIAQKKGTDEIFYELKGVVEVLLEKMRVDGFEWVRPQSISGRSIGSVCHPQKWVAIKINKRVVGFLGEVSKKILGVLKIKGRVVLFELDFEELQKLASEERQYEPICPYPSARRDLAVLVPSSIPAARVFDVINKTGGFLLKKTDLFDVYQGKEIPRGKKNLAFHLIYQAEDRTLEAKEIDELHERIIGALEKNPGWEVRK
jgi:phenylalanyl-tRNA synthetase beta chain